ncbi:MAG: helix-turn-helix domain-containing protein [Pseudomonadota bacterium]
MAIKAHLESSSNEIENRRHTRRALFLETQGVIPGGAVANVTVHNLSVAGLLLETDAELTDGETLSVALPEVGAVLASVVWRSGDLYGCVFDQTLSEAALAAASLRGTVIGSLDPVLPIGSSGQQALGTAPIQGRAEPFGVRLNRLRRERAMTLSDVADALGVSKPTVWAWEKGKAKPIPERLDAIAEALGVSSDELRVAGGNGDGAALVEECRLRIATTFGTDPHNVRIMIEV